MKSISNKKTSRKKTFLIIGILLIVGIGGTIAYIVAGYNKKDENSSKVTDTPKAVTDTDQKGIIPSDTLPDDSQSITSDDVPVSKTASANITRLEQKDTTVYFDATIVNAAQLGKCVVTFSTPNDKPVTKEFDATKNGDSYICSLTTSALEFSYLGEWNVTLRYYNGDNQVVAKGAITIS